MAQKKKSFKNVINYILLISIITAIAYPLVSIFVIFPFFNDLIIKNPELTASIRYRHQPQAGKLDLNKQEFLFETPQRAIAEGQSIVFYHKDVCLGGAVIS